MLLIRDLDTWGRHGRGARQSALADQSLGLSGIGFVPDPVIMPSDAAIQRSSLLRVAGPRPETRTTDISYSAAMLLSR